MYGACGFEPGGRRFESVRARLTTKFPAGPGSRRGLLDRPIHLPGDRADARFQTESPYHRTQQEVRSHYPAATRPGAHKPAPTKIPTIAEHHKVAAVLSPCTFVPSRKIIPAPRKPYR